MELRLSVGARSSVDDWKDEVLAACKRRGAHTAAVRFEYGSCRPYRTAIVAVYVSPNTFYYTDSIELDSAFAPLPLTVALPEVDPRTASCRLLPMLSAEDSTGYLDVLWENYDACEELWSQSDAEPNEKNQHVHVAAR